MTSHLDPAALRKAILRLERIPEQERTWTQVALLKAYREDLARLRQGATK